MKTRMLALVLPCLAGFSAYADEDDHVLPPDNLPAALQVPAGEELFFEATGVGVQIYDCKLVNGASVWGFRAPEALLYSGDGDADDRLLGHHFAGPTWADGHGSVVAKAVGNVPAADPTTTVPWLRLVAISHTGHARFAQVTTIQRLNTVGGAAPAGSCNLGDVAQVPYRANYFFYKLADE